MFRIFISGLLYCEAYFNPGALMLSYFYEDFAVAKDYFCTLLFTFDTNEEEIV